MARVRCAVVMLLTLSGVLLATEGGAREWYVAPAGVDGGAGTETTPLATLAHAIGRASAGDTVLLQRGGTYPAMDLDVASGLALNAWGSGARPVVTGSARVTMTGVWGADPAVRTATVAQRVIAC